jgi:hypothetical protein
MLITVLKACVGLVGVEVVFVKELGPMKGTQSYHLQQVGAELGLQEREELHQADLWDKTFTLRKGNPGL